MAHIDPEKRRAYNKHYYHEGPGKAKAQDYHLKLKLAAFNAYGGVVCCRCGFSDHRALHLDHISGGGHQDRITAGSRTIYGRLKKQSYPPGFQVLCANCNFIKRYTNNEHPGPHGR